MPGFVTPNLKIGGALAILWQNPHLLRGFPLSTFSFFPNPWPRPAYRPLSAVPAQAGSGAGRPGFPTRCARTSGVEFSPILARKQIKSRQGGQGRPER